ncbi:MAG: helix-turn-helix transcriptional regulator [Rhizobiaceae bacterium]
MDHSSHEKVWAAIDALAARNAMSPSGLAKQAGLDSTAFNKSKRRSAGGRPRWPSMESVMKIVEATNSRLSDFAGLVENSVQRATDALPAQGSSVPLVGFAQAGAGGFFDDAGFPAGQGWDLVEIPSGAKRGTYALSVQGNSMMPLYRDGDILIVDPEASIRRGDRVVARTGGGEIMAKILQRRTSRQVELSSLNPEHPDRVFELHEIEWLARIVWASQ